MGNLKVITATKKESSYRYERKFFISDLTKHEVEALVKLHPAIFSEIYHQRSVNNIYFDTVDLKNYFDNVEGSTNRVKVRIRWYGDLFGAVSKPVLEYKIKDGFLGRKKSLLLHPFEIQNDFNKVTISNIFDKSDIPGSLKLNLQSLEPALLNRYSRSYFQSANKNYRITIDSDLVYYRVGHQYNAFLHHFFDDRNVILELKYGQSSDQDAHNISSYFPFRLTKSSKYVMGIDKLYAW